MKDFLRRAGIVFSFLFLLLVTGSLVANASDFGPGRGRDRDRPPVQSVAEPAAIALLGAGLVSLAIYSRKKRGKKQ